MRSVRAAVSVLAIRVESQFYRYGYLRAIMADKMYLQHLGGGEGGGGGGGIALW